LNHGDPEQKKTSHTEGSSHWGNCVLYKNFPDLVKLERSLMTNALGWLTFGISEPLWYKYLGDMLSYLVLGKSAAILRWSVEMRE
jgi:hypothetical protein